MPKQNHQPMWMPQHRGIQYSAESLAYRYHLTPTKPFPTAFKNTTSVTTMSYPRLEGFTALSDGSSRDSVLKRHLATTLDATVAVDGKRYPVPKGAITLVEWLPNKTYRLSIPLVGDAIDDVDDTESSVDAGPLDRTHPASAADAADAA
jgi:hypothetical protein